jgi:hypothetical protein
VRPRTKLAAEFGIVALVALALTALPGGGATLDVVLTLLLIAFFTAIALLGYRLYRQFSFELDTLDDRQRLTLYGALGLAFLTFCATTRLFDVGGAGIVAWLALLGLCSYGVYRVWTAYRSDTSY